ncbi:MAG: phosphatase PAP2 family protein [Ruminiclostridium sp.]|nr:phosphatase PAP2 family protein [Ruminiclostridium sp.]
MDIEYLLFWQSFRNSINDALTPFMEMISLFAVTYLIIVPTFIYWCVDKRKGLYTLASYNVCVAVNAVVKLTCCVYRPWIRDSRILPAGDAITTATGYSFPSGHTSTAVPIYGGLAVGAWKKMRWVSVICIICIALTGFSRNYLGVHTPQDVLVGLTFGIVTLWLMSVLFSYLEAHPGKENIFLAAGVIFGIAALFYITLKPYPMDIVDGEILVDPRKMMTDGYGDIGMMIAFCVGRFVEKTWIKYEPVLTKKTLAAGVTGVVLTFFLIETIKSPLRELLGQHWGSLAANSVIMIFIVALWPAVMKAVTRSEKTDTDVEKSM